MIKSVAILKSSDAIDIETLEYGRYQPILSPRDKWPSGSGKLWQREMGKARLDLATQPNSTSLSKDEPGIVPAGRNVRCWMPASANASTRTADPDADRREGAGQECTERRPARHPADLEI